MTEWPPLLRTPQQRLPMLFNWPNNPKIAPSRGGPRPYLIHVPWPTTWASATNGISIGSAAVAQHIRVTRQTDRHTAQLRATSVALLPHHAMRPYEDRRDCPAKLRQRSQCRWVSKVGSARRKGGGWDAIYLESEATVRAGRRCVALRHYRHGRSWRCGSRRRWLCGRSRWRYGSSIPRCNSPIYFRRPTAVSAAAFQSTTLFAANDDNMPCINVEVVRFARPDQNCLCPSGSHNFLLGAYAYPSKKTCKDLGRSPLLGSGAEQFRNSQFTFSGCPSAAFTYSSGQILLP